MKNSLLINEDNLIQKKIRFAPLCTRHYIGLKKPYEMFRQGKILESLCVKSWEIAPGNTTITPKAYFLKGQLERIIDTAYTVDPNAMNYGGYKKKHEPTRAYLLKDVWMLNGSIFKGLNQFKFHPPSQIKNSKYYFSPITVETEINNASIYSSYNGNEFFGMWLTDDCSMYSLAASEGLPVTSNIYASKHMLEYESLLDMKPFRTNGAFIKNALFFDDNWGNNESKHERFSANRNKLLSNFPAASHPGIFILRGNSGKTRIMLNEIEIAEQLRDKYGFKIVDVTKHSAAEIISESIGAQILVGIEGSHLLHGLMVLQPGTSVLTLQPPNRFCGVIKVTTDMENQNFGFVVGIPKKDGFYVDLEEVERTLDLFPKNNWH